MVNDRYAAALKEKALRATEAQIRESLATRDAMIAVAYDIAEEQIEKGNSTYLDVTGIDIDDEAGVVAAEAKGIVQRDPDPGRPGLIRDVVKVAFRIGHLIIDGWRDDLIADGQCAEDRLDRPGGAHDMPGH